MQDRIAYQGITFDDVLLEPCYSDVVPRDVDVRTQLTRNIRLNIPILSSPMDTVTESELAIALAQEGGIGIIHKNLAIPTQTREVDKVKRSENGVITDPITLAPGETVRTARQIMQTHHISGVPITVGDDRKLVGILTRRDLKFLQNNDQLISEVMTKDNLVTAPEQTTLQEAERMLNENKVEKLLLVDDLYRLKGLITIKDIEKNENFPMACKDGRGRLRVGAAIGVLDYERADSLIRAGVDLLIVDSAHGHSRNVTDTVRELKKRYRVDIIAGNVATEAGARAAPKRFRGLGGRGLHRRDPRLGRAVWRRRTAAHSRARPGDVQHLTGPIRPRRNGSAIAGQRQLVRGLGSNHPASRRAALGVGLPRCKRPRLARGLPPPLGAQGPRGGPPVGVASRVAPVGTRPTHRAVDRERVARSGVSGRKTRGFIEDRRAGRDARLDTLRTRGSGRATRGAVDPREGPARGLRLTGATGTVFSRAAPTSPQSAIRRYD